MDCILSFWWNKSDNEICYMIVSSDYAQILLAPYQIQVSSTNDIDRELAHLSNQILQSWTLKVEYKILHSYPVANVRGGNFGPDILSVHMKTEFENHFSSRQGQMRHFLTNGSLRKFKKGLRNLRHTQQNQAWVEKLWMIATHASNSNYDSKLKKLWAAKTQISATTQAGKMQFQAWFQAL